MKKINIKRTAALALAAALALGALTAGAAYLTRWPRDMEAEMHTTEAQRLYAEDIGLAAAPGRASATDKGVTITAVQTLVDNYYAKLSFRIDGFAALLPEGAEPCVDWRGIRLDGREAHNYYGGFYNGIVPGPDGIGVYEDGAPLRFTDGGAVEEHYADENGSLIYQVSIAGDGMAGQFFGKEIEVAFTGLGTVYRTEYTPILEGDWTLRWMLSGTDEIRSAAPGIEIGDTGAVLVEAEVSPISLRALIRTDGLWTGYETLDTYYPALTGVRLRDGTVYTGMFAGPGHEGYADMDALLYEVSFATDRIVDPAEVEALAFLTAPSEGAGEQPTAAENLCFVPLD